MMFSRSARIRTFSTCVEYQNMSVICRFLPYIKRPGLNMRYESGTKYIFLILQMLVKCCFLETILRYCGSGVEPTYIYNVCGALKGCISKGCRRNQIR